MKDKETTLADRLSIALANSGYRKADVARYCKVTPASVSDWFSGKAKSIKVQHLTNVANFLNVSTQWLATGRGDMTDTNIIAYSNAESLNDDDWVEIPEYRARFAAGYDQEPTLEELDNAYKAVYRRDWFIKRRVNPAHCKRFRAVGDSMEPLILDDDVLLVDCSKKIIVDGHIYAFNYAGSLRVKRLYQKMNGEIIVKSENPSYHEEKIDSCEVDRIQIIGEVIERSGSI